MSQCGDPVGSRFRGNDVAPGMTWGRGALRPVVALARRLDSRLRGNDGTRVGSRLRGQGVGGGGGLGTWRVARRLVALARRLDSLDSQTKCTTRVRWRYGIPTHRHRGTLRDCPPTPRGAPDPGNRCSSGSLAIDDLSRDQPQRDERGRIQSRQGGREGAGAAVGRLPPRPRRPPARGRPAPHGVGRVAAASGRAPRRGAQRPVPKPTMPPRHSRESGNLLGHGS